MEPITHYKVIITFGIAYVVCYNVVYVLFVYIFVFLPFTVNKVYQNEDVRPS